MGFQLKLQTDEDFDKEILLLIRGRIKHLLRDEQLITQILNEEVKSQIRKKLNELLPNIGSTLEKSVREIKSELKTIGTELFEEEVKKSKVWRDLLVKLNKTKLEDLFKDEIEEIKKSKNAAK